MGSSIEARRTRHREYCRQWREKHKEELREYQRLYMRKRRAADPEKAKLESRLAMQRRWRDDPERERKKLRERYHKLTPEQKRELAANFRKTYPETVRAVARRWAKANPSKKNAETAKRRARRLQAMPKWVDRAALRLIYIKCRSKSEETGIKHHVDHIVPLKGANVCGLHVPWNLQIIPAAENHRKSNKVLVA